MQRAALASLLISSAALAQTDLSFSCISGRLAACETGEAQIGVRVSMDAATACFTFTNTGDEASSIARLYFDDRSGLLGDAAVINTPGVQLAEEPNASPPNLPGGQPFGFETSFRFAAVQPPPHNGINPGEEATICFGVADHTSLQDLRLALADGRLRIGLHVIAFDDGDSASFINAPVCLADYNNDSSVNSMDFFDYVTDFFAMNPRADINDDGAVDSADFMLFTQLFMQGCERVR